MSGDRVTSPTLFNGDIEHIYDPNFTEEINKKMQVPKRIKVNGDNEEDVIIGIGGNHPAHAWENEKFEMLVPERILVVGQEQCIGTKKAAGEDSHDHVIIPPDPGFVRVQTPPRVISLTEHYFPSVDDAPTPIEMDDPPQSPVVVHANRPRPIIDADVSIMHQNDFHHNQSLREDAPVLTDEIVHLRRQLAKLNRRVMTIESELLLRQQYERIAYGLGIAYVIWKALLWLRN